MSTLNVNTIKDASGTDDSLVISGQNTVKMWAHWDGTGTVSLDASFNVDSLADDGTGRYTLTITTDFGSANYAAVVTADPAVFGGTDSAQLVAGSFRTTVYSHAGALTDSSECHAVALGDQ